MLEATTTKSTTTDKPRPNPYDLHGILPDWAIRQFIKDGYIGIDPLPENWKEEMGPMTIDFNLGDHLRWYKKADNTSIDTRYTTREDLTKMMHEVNLKPDQPFVLTEEKRVVAATRQRMRLPDDIVAKLHGKSSLARIFTFSNITADRFDPGWDGKPVLEIMTAMPDTEVVLYEGMLICAFSFERLPWGVERPYMDKLIRTFGGSDEAQVADLSYTTRVRTNGMR